MSGLPGRDRDGGYGWISITLHWLTAVAIFALLYVGDSISVGGDATLRTHTTIAACAWILLAARIAWRVVEGHPPPLGRAGWTSRLGEVTHWALLAAVGLMLVSGPLAALSHEAGLRIFGLTLHGPWPHRPALAISAAAHGVGAFTLVWGVVLHVAGVGWHLVVKRDGLFDRIMVPPRRPPIEN